MFFGFFLENGEINEQVPTIFKQLSRLDRYKIFITQFNAVVDNGLKINTKSLDEHENLLELFTQKINSLIEDKEQDLCELSEYFIKCFQEGKTDKLKSNFAKVPTHPAAKLIQMIWCRENPGIYFESSWLFCNYVYEKISRCHYDKQVSFKDGLIVVSRDGEDLIAVMPSFKYVCMDKPHLADEEIKKAYKILGRRDVQKFYIAFPKHDEFKRHIVVKHGKDDTSSKLTLVPYAISHKIKYNKPNFK